MRFIRSQASQRTRGAAMAEFLVTLPALLVLGLGGVQSLFWYNAKTTMSYATFEAARVGAVTHAQRPRMRQELGLRLAPLFGGDGSPTGALTALQRASTDVLDPRFTQIEILNPTREAFDDFGIDNPDNGKKEIPNDNLRHRPREVETKSGVNIQDANLLKIKATYGYQLKVPLIDRIVPALLKQTDPAHSVYYDAGRIPLVAYATVRMQSPAWPDGNISADGSGGGGVVPGDGGGDPGESQPPGGDGDSTAGDGDGQGGDGDSTAGDGDGQGGDPILNPNPNPNDPLCLFSSCDQTDPPLQSPIDDPNAGNNGDPNICVADPNTPAARPSGTPATAVGNPIHVVTGNKYQAETDLPPLAGTLGLRLVRHYNSQSRYRGPLGHGWRHSYELQLAAHGDGYRLTQADGRRIDFRPSGQADRYLPQRAGDGWLARDPAGVTWHWRDGRRLRFNPEAQLIRISDASGKTLQLHHDPQGRLFLIQDPQGRELTLVHYPNGRLKALLDPVGRETRYRYDERGNLESVTQADGRTRQYHYEDPRDPHNLTGITDERGIRYASWVYDEQDRAIESSHIHEVGKVSLDFSTDGQTRVTDSQGKESVYHTETRNGTALVTRIDGPGCSTCGVGDMQYRYNEQIQVTRVSNKDGSSTAYTYDALGRTSEIIKTFADGEAQRVAAYEYPDGELKPSAILRPSINPDGEHRVEIGYNPAQQPTTITERGYTPTKTGFAPIERTTTLAYDGSDLVAIDGPRTEVQDIIRLAYDSRHRLKSLTGPDGRPLTVKGYDAYGRPSQIQRGSQSPIHIDYTAQGQIAKVTQYNQSVSYTYTPTGQLESLTGPDGKTLSLDYDDADRAIGFTGPDGRQVRDEIDSEGRLTQRNILNQNGQLIQSLSHLYDAQGRLERSQRNGRVSEYDYDASGRLRQISDGQGNNTRLDYGPLGQLRSLIAPDQNQVSLHYDDKGEAIGLTDPRDNTTEQQKDDFGNIVQHSNPDTGIVTYQYDAAGNRVQKIDAEGRTTIYAYDAANRLIEEESAEGLTRLNYDAQSGGLNRIESPDTTETFEYNEEGQLIAHTREIDGHAFTTGYARAADAQQRLSQKTLPDGQILNYHYYEDGNQQGKLRAITQQILFGFGQETLIGEIDQDKTDGITGHTYGNGIRTEHHFDEYGQLSRITNNQTLELIYSYDEYGRITGIDLDGQLQAYHYDQYSRLIGTDTRSGQYRYAYDNLGNRTEKQHVDKQGNKQTERYDYPEEGQGNRLLSRSLGEGRGEGDQQNLTYNAAGSPIETNGLSYEYNAKQRPIKVYRDNQLLAEYTYNRFGERIKKVVFNNNKKPKVTYFLYDGHTLTAEANEKGDITAQYLYLKGHQPVAKLEQSGIYAIHLDHLGTPRAATNDQGETVWLADYSPFGKAKIKTQQITLNLRLPGQYEDQETGTYYNYFRDYNPVTGRYQTSDPIGLKGGLNTYAYVGGNPLSGIDPLGLDIEILVGDSYPGHSYGHVALRVFGDGYDNTYDFGRYSNTWGVGNSEGEGMLRVWSDFNRYIAGEKATTRTTSGYVFSTTKESDNKIIDYYNNLIIGKEPALSRGNYMRQYRISDYHAGNNNCTTVALDSLEIGLPDELFESINNTDFQEGRGLSWYEKLLFKNAIDNRELLRLPLDLQAAIESGGAYSKENTNGYEKINIYKN